MGWARCVGALTGALGVGTGPAHAASAPTVASRSISRRARHIRPIYARAARCVPALASRSASRANFSSSPRKLPSYDPREKIHDEMAEIRPTVSNVWMTRVPSPSGSKVALDRPRSSQLPNRVAKSRGRSTSRISVGLFIGPKWTTYVVPAWSTGPDTSLTPVTPPTHSPMRSRFVQSANTCSGGAATRVEIVYRATVSRSFRPHRPARAPPLRSAPGAGTRSRPGHCRTRATSPTGARAPRRRRPAHGPRACRS